MHMLNRREVPECVLCECRGWHRPFGVFNPPRVVGAG